MILTEIIKEKVKNVNTVLAYTFLPTFVSLAIYKFRKNWYIREREQYHILHSNINQYKMMQHNPNFPIFHIFAFLFCFLSYFF